MTIDGRSIKDPKQRGEWAELRFMSRAAEHGLRVSKPWGDSARYDFAVEHEGAFLRIQVKSTTQKRGRCYVLRIQLYTDSEIDFLVAYIIPEDAWFILPIEVVMRTPGALTLSPHLVASRHGVYKEAWHLLKGR
jgi:hypothetical protein